MGKIFKIIFGAILLYIGGKIVYNNVKPEEEKPPLQPVKDLKDINF